jgi:hypothetical protein
MVLEEVREDTVPHITMEALLVEDQEVMVELHQNH